MSSRRKPRQAPKRARHTPAPPAPRPAASDEPTPAAPLPELPRGRMPAIGMREMVAALHRRRERRRAMVAELRTAVGRLTDAVAHHRERIAAVQAAIEAQGGDLSHLKHYDSFMARMRAELRAAEQALADAFRSAAGSEP